MISLHSMSTNKCAFTIKPRKTKSVDKQALAECIKCRLPDVDIDFIRRVLRENNYDIETSYSELGGIEGSISAVINQLSLISARESEVVCRGLVLDVLQSCGLSVTKAAEHISSFLFKGDSNVQLKCNPEEKISAVDEHFVAFVDAFESLLSREALEVIWVEEMTAHPQKKMAEIILGAATRVLDEEESMDSITAAEQEHIFPRDSKEAAAVQRLKDQLQDRGIDDDAIIFAFVECNFDEEQALKFIIEHSASLRSSSKHRLSYAEMTRLTTPTAPNSQAPQPALGIDSTRTIIKSSFKTNQVMVNRAQPHMVAKDPSCWTEVRAERQRVRLSLRENFGETVFFNIHSKLLSLKKSCSVLKTSHLQASILSLSSRNPSIIVDFDSDKQYIEFLGFREPPEAVVTIDLHGVYLAEALDLTGKVIDFYRSNYFGKVQHLRFIVGKGLHSPGRSPRLRPAILRLIERLGLSYRATEDTGDIFIDLSS